MTEGPYKLPEGWRWVRLGEVAETKMGGTPSTKVPEYWEPPEVIWITPEDLNKDTLTRVFASRRFISRMGLENSSAKLFPSRTVLLSTTATIGKVGIAEKELSANQQISGIICKGVNPDFLAYYLLGLGETRLKQLGGTATATHINQKSLRALPVPLPPLSEQRRIVARIEELMARVREARRLRQQAREDAQRLWQSVLTETFPRPSSDLPEGWRWVRLGEVCEHLRSSVDPRRHPDEEFSLYSIPAYDSGMRPERVKGTQIGSTKLLVDGGVCLFSKLNPRIPRAWVVRNSDPSLRMLASTEFMPLKPIQPLLDLDFLGIMLITKTLLEQVTRDVSGATGSRQRLKPQVVLSALIPLPPLEEQRRIVAH